MWHKATDASPTLKALNLDPVLYDNDENQEIYGDMFYWFLKGALTNRGLYDKSGTEVNEFFKNVHDELTLAFENGTLKQNLDDRIYISPLARGLTYDEIAFCAPYFIERIRHLLRYIENQTTTNAAWGGHEDLILMSAMTNSFMLWEDSGIEKKIAEKTVNIAKIIVLIYQKTGYLVGIISGIGILLMFIQTVRKILRKDYSGLNLPTFTFAILSSGICLTVGISWFCSWMDERKFYDYMCGGLVIINIVEAIGIYFLVTFLLEKLKNR